MTQLKVPKPDLQIAFYLRLQDLRKTCLLDALLSVVSGLSIQRIDKELNQYVSEKALQQMAGWGLRGELLFAVPYVLHENPMLLAYYRLLLGFSQKQFYGSRYGFSPFKAMEERGRLPKGYEMALQSLASVLCKSAELFIAGIDGLTRESVHDLTLLTLGPQLRGGTLNLLGVRATRAVFELISAMLKPAIVSATDRSIEIKNAAGRVVKVEFASDPDICIREKLPSGNYRNLVAIEIKGGADYSNIHNRIGEAEKSHQKARKDGYVECWTMVGVIRLDTDLAKRESPTTDRFYRIEQLVREESSELGDFRENLLSRVGIKD
jgi:hypothetical protein